MSAPAYYNEIDPYCAAWIRNLIAAGHIAPGDVDERDIQDVRPDDLRGYTQCHFFAGIGVWSSALRLAGWPDDRPVWTGSCPCQPFSAAGKGAGFADERHLWPAFFHLIRELSPARVFGEQVASVAVDAWIDLVQDDMEAVDYSFAAIAFPSAGVGAPHIRDRTYWVADGAGKRWNGRQDAPRTRRRIGTETSGVARRLADANGGQCDGVAVVRGIKRDWQDAGRSKGFSEFEPSSDICHTSPTNGFWRDADWLFCRDGKWRPVEPSTFPLAHGASSRVGRLRAYGNAINREAAATFIKAATTGAAS